MGLSQEEYGVLIINPHKVNVYATVHYSLKGHHTELQAGRAEVPPGGQHMLGLMWSRVQSPALL